MGKRNGMRRQWVERLMFVTVLAGCVLWICRQQRTINALQVGDSHLTDKLDAAVTEHRRMSDSLAVINGIHRDSIAALSVKIDSLQQIKQQITVRYEKKKNDLYNPDMVGGDSVYRYILRSINAKR
jgi:hypothetical protein